MNDDFDKFSHAIQHSAIIRDNTLVRDFTAKETIFIEKDLCDEVYFILAGEVKVTSFHTNGKEVWHATLSEGYTFGEMAAISGRSRSATVETLKPSKIGILEKAHFLTALESDPGVALSFLKDMVARLPKILGAAREDCPYGCDKALEFAIITQPPARDPEMVAKLKTVAGRVLDDTA